MWKEASRIRGSVVTRAGLEAEMPLPDGSLGIPGGIRSRRDQDLAGEETQGSLGNIEEHFCHKVHNQATSSGQKGATLQK